MASSLQYRRSATNGNTSRLLSMNRPTSMRPISSATSIDNTSDTEDTRRRSRPAQGWATRKQNMLMRTVEEKEDVSDAESFDSLSSRAKFMSDLLSDSDSSIDGRGSISSYGPITPRTPSPEYTNDGYPMVEIVDEKSPRRRASSMEASPTFAARVKEMTTVGPRGPHLFRSYSTNHSTNIAHINIPRTSFPPTPSASETSRSPASPHRHAKAEDAPQLTPSSDSEPIVLMRPKSDQTVTSEYDLEEVRSWLPNQVCVWMAALGFDHETVDKFAKNDISGNILIDLKWDDLKELDIQSFGKRIELWTEIHHLRARSLPTPDRAEFIRSSTRVPRSNSPTPRMRSNSTSSTASQMIEIGRVPSIFETMPLPELPASAPQAEKSEVVSEADEEGSDEGYRVRNRPQLRKKRRTNVRMPRRQVSVDSIIITSDDDFPGNYVAKLEALTSFDKSRPTRRNRSRLDHLVPEDSVSLRGTRKQKHKKASTEERQRRPHQCSKGERCRKHGKIRRPRSEVRSEHGTILIATTPSIADYSALPRISALESVGRSPRPQSMASSSILASSDVLGPIQSKDIKLIESALREISRVDPLENVKQFLTHQHLQHLEERRDSPPPVPSKSTEDILRAQRSTSPPNSAPPHSFNSQTPSNGIQTRPQTLSVTQLPPRTSSATPAPPTRSQTPSFGLRIQGMEQVVPPYPNFSVPSRVRSPGMMRTTTPFSEADVPCPTGTPFNFRDQSQSVPPDMNYRRFPTPTIESLSAPVVPRAASVRPAMLHMTAVDENAEWEAIDEEVKMAPSPNMRTHSGWMKKRRTNWFRHEWPDYHFVLKGTRLGYARDVATGEVGSIDMDQYQVACSNTGSTKLSAAFKAGRIFGKKKDDGTPGSYFFQLVPANEVAKGKKSLGKVHCFSVNSREERIDWMRELMLAKAIKQKGQGFEVEVNGERV